jgi:hypothetical protein
MSFSIFSESLTSSAASYITSILFLLVFNVSTISFFVKLETAIILFDFLFAAATIIGF